VTGYDLTPREMRPAIELNGDGYPELYGKAYRECWIFSAEYRAGFRPPLNQEIGPEDITAWQVLKMEWE